MPKKTKKLIKVRDLKPAKDAKGGGPHLLGSSLGSHTSGNLGTNLGTSLGTTNTGTHNTGVHN